MKPKTPVHVFALLIASAAAIPVDSADAADICLASLRCAPGRVDCAYVLENCDGRIMNTSDVSVLDRQLKALGYSDLGAVSAGRENIVFAKSGTAVNDESAKFCLLQKMTGEDGTSRNEVSCNDHPEISGVVPSEAEALEKYLADEHLQAVMTSAIDGDVLYRVRR